MEFTYNNWSLFQDLCTGLILPLPNYTTIYNPSGAQLYVISQEDYIQITLQAMIQIAEKAHE